MTPAVLIKLRVSEVGGHSFFFHTSNDERKDNSRHVAEVGQRHLVTQGL